MNKELIDRAWCCLPREFHEEVKKMFEEDKKHPEIHTTCGITTAYHNNMGQRLIDLFGIHNLTSDAEGEEEMLYVSRKQIDALQGEIFKAIMDAHDADDWQDAAHYILDVMPRSFAAIFGSKCLPDEKDCATCQDITCKNYGTVNGHCRFIEHCSYEPKPVEPKADKYFDTILKDGFRNERRLNIAATIMVGLLASCKDKYPIKRALELANALIAECEKKEGQDA